MYIYLYLCFQAVFIQPKSLFFITVKFFIYIEYLPFLFSIQSPHSDLVESLEVS